MITNAIVNPVSSRKAMLRQWQTFIAKVEDDGIREGYETTLRKAIEILDGMEKAVDAIRTNAALSEQGIGEKINELAKATLKDFTWLFSKADEAEAAYTRLHAVLFALPDAPKGFTEIELALREQELRTWLRSLSEPECMKVYTMAIPQGETEIIRAFKRAPGRPLILLEIVERVDREHIEQTKPKESLRLQSLDVLRQELRAIATMLQGWLGSYGQDVNKFPTHGVIKDGHHLVGGR
ncbi:MAG: hypothetical protein Q8L77_14610 [Nitrospirota bacterium]|nr:hypothetical protein [Nitrospirota bacterium]